MQQAREQNPILRRRVVVHGRVQGVFFRASTQTEARSVGVHGEVRNLPDGNVEAILEGPAQAVHAMIEFCRRGPAAAQVNRIEIFDEPACGLRDFQIRR